MGVTMEGARWAAAGRFSASFALGRKRRTAKGGHTAAPGSYAFQAHIMGATRIAAADSNVVFLHVGVTPPEQKVEAREPDYAIGLDDVLRPDQRTAEREEAAAQATR